MKIPRMIAIALLGAVAATAWAQKPADGKPGRDGAKRAGQQGRLAAVVQQLPQRLKLDEEQKAQFDELVAKYRASAGQPGDAQKDTADLARQIREAKQAGDEAKVRELRQQMRGQRGGGERIQGFLDELEGILRDDQKEILGQMRERLQNAKDGAAAGPGGAGIEARMRELQQQLALAPEQEKVFDEAVAAARQKLKPEGEPALPELLRQAREAAQGGDRQQAKDIHDRIEARRRAAESALSEFQAAVEPVLNDQQKQTLKQFGQQAATALNPGKNDGAARNDPRMLLRAARRLDLTQEQKDQLDAIQKDLGERARQPGTEKPTPALLRSEIEKQIREILTPEQAAQFDEILARQAKVGAKDGARRDKKAADGQKEPGEKPRRKAKDQPGEKQENP